MADTAYDYDVLVTGAGPVGLALATELAKRGRTVCVIEQNERVGLQPRAKTTNVRTMTHMRRWGLAEEMRRRSSLSADFPRQVRFATALFGHDIFCFQNAFCASPQKDDRYPEHAEFIPQYVVEGILLDHVRAEPLATVMLQTRLEDFEQLSAGGIRAETQDLRSGARNFVTARFLVGADGARSTVRKRLGIEMQGLHSLISFVTLILRIPGLNTDPELNHALFHWLVNPAAPCVMGPMDRDGTWFWGMAMRPGADPSDEDLLSIVHTAMRKDFDIEILARDPWTVHKLLAERYSQGDVFLAGDACHLHSPFGGHGMNLGIADAVDLGWKMAAVLDGWAERSLLDTYEPERKPLHGQVLDTSTENVASLSEHFLAPAIDQDTDEGAAQRAAAAAAVEKAKSPEFRSLGIVLGYRYESSAIAREDDGPPPFAVTRYSPSGYPGSLAPHAWLADGSSLYDHFADGFTLLRLGQAAMSQEDEILAAARARGVPLAVYEADDPDLAALYGAAYALIRPDQHVAWRGNAIDHPQRLLDMVCGAAEKSAATAYKAKAANQGRGT